MYHLLSVSSAMLISFLDRPAVCRYVCHCGPPKRVFHCIVYPAGLFWQAHLLAYSDSSTRSDAGAVRVRPSEAGAVLSTPTDGRTGAGFGTKRPPRSLPPRQRMLKQRPPSVRRTPLPSFPPGRRRSSPAPGVAATRRAIGIPATPVACRFNMNMNKYRRCRYVCCAEP